MRALPQALQADFEKLQASHTAFLARHGVKLPSEDSQQAVVLIYLYRHLEQLVSLEDLRSFVRSHWDGRSQDIQPRHLKYDGWHVLLSGKSNDRLKKAIQYKGEDGVVRLRNAGEKLPNGYLMLFSVVDPSPDFVLKKRRGKIDRTSWDSIKAAYGFCCAVCRERRELEQGHMDPTKQLTPDNTLPMCSDCNNWASNDVVLDARGRVVALASEKFVLRSDLAVRIRVFAELQKDVTVNPGGRRRGKRDAP